MSVDQNKNNAFVVWLTGLSASGKSTLAQMLYMHFRNKGFSVEHLDGDLVRSIFPETGFTKTDRDEHIRRIGFIGSLLERNGIIVIASFISPYREARRAVRQMCNNFIEVYVSASLEECERRDPKGLYKKARAGGIKHFTGIDDPYEIPEFPEIIVNTEKSTKEESFQKLLYFINLKSDHYAEIKNKLPEWQ